MPYTTAQVIECFHLAFLGALPERLPRDAYVLKGGANLRYFYGSFRYSEDIDLDVLRGESWWLADKVNEALVAASLRLPLQRVGVEVVELHPLSKQTETTQRWKLALGAEGHRNTISTSIEFSRRNGDTRWQLDAIPEAVVEPYALRPPTTLRYLPAAAIEQKAIALARRSRTQARDVFDLELLFRGHPDAVVPGAISAGDLKEAVRNCLALEFDAYAAQVVPFLDAAIAASYEGLEVWEQTQLYVAEKLEQLDAAA